MIPHQLQIKNFLSYGPETQTIDFSNYHLICLSGKNGHGKSAMLDAITWAIWGQARKSSGTSKPDAGLLHLGQKHMMVILEFEVNGQHYRVRREYLNTASKPFATLDFGVRQPDGKQIPLTDKTIKDTQEKIERTIGITYESFTNSTFLRQGQSNEFSKKSPKERKEILAQILQLQKFEDQKKIALMHARKVHQDYTTQTNINQRIEQELINLASVPEQYAMIQAKLEQLEVDRKTLLNHKTTLVLQHQELAQQFNEQKFLLHQKEEIENSIILTQQEIAKLEQIVKEQPAQFDEDLLKQEEQRLHNLVQQLQDAQQKKLVLKETYLATKEKLTEQTRIIQHQSDTQTQLLQVQAAKLQQATLHLKKQLITEQIAHKALINESSQSKEQLDNLNNKLQILSTIKEQYQQTEDLFEKNKVTYQNLCAQGTYLKQQLTHLDQQCVQSHDTQVNRCSRCEQSLNPEQQQFVIQKLILEKNQTELLLQQTKDQAQQLKNDLSAQHLLLQQLKQQSEQYIQQSAQLQEHNKQHEKLLLQLQIQEQKIASYQQEEKTLATQTQTVEQELKNIAQQLQQNLQHPDIQQLTQKLQTIEQEAKLIAYQPQEHQASEKKLTEIRALLSQHAAANNKNLQAEQKALILQLHKKIHSAHEQLAQLLPKIAVFTGLEQRKKDLAKEEQQHETSLQQLEITYRNLLVEKGSLDHKQKKRVELEAEIASIGCNIKSLYQEMTDYQEIAKALGKDGIQALLIEQAIPEIEHETNQILARLTNNQTQIFIESLRDLKKGGSRETLDIKISDSFGLRDYEMFSGGEAFRIDFALRIGISKLLARRAGTTLQTIFIDEGFGSQDEEGLQLIMDNIYKIQDDFAKIIIVSHLPEMKEQFPVQFVIEKKRSGSTVSIVHQG